MKMILIQDGSQNTNVDKPLRIIGDPYKVQVRTPGGDGLLQKGVTGRAGDLSEGGEIFKCVLLKSALGSHSHTELDRVGREQEA